MTSPILSTEALWRNYGGLTAVRDVSLAIRQGELRALIGPNGAGKSTLLNLLAGTVRPTKGRVFFRDQDITGAPVHKRARLGIGRSYQVVTLFGQLTCREVIELALQRDCGTRGWLSKGRAADRARDADRVLDAAGLGGIAEFESTSISHGMQKRLELALCLACESELLLLDEPMAGMSTSERGDLRDLLRGMTPRRTVVFVEHDMDMVMTLADRVTVLHNGSVIADGKPEEVRSNEMVRRVYLHAASNV